jgi:hypothetical protein
MFRPLLQQVWLPKKESYRKENVLLSGRLFWPLNREVHEVEFTKPSHNNNNAVCVARKSTSSYDEFNNGVTMCSSGSGGATEAEMANWSELLYIWHLAAKVFTILVLDWSGLSAQTIGGLS